MRVNIVFGIWMLIASLHLSEAADIRSWNAYEGEKQRTKREVSFSNFPSSLLLETEQWVEKGKQAMSIQEVTQYRLLLKRAQQEEKVWEIEHIRQGFIMVNNGRQENIFFESGTHPFFELSEVAQYNTTIWIFFWKEPRYYLEAQQQRDGTWENMQSISLEREYNFLQRCSITVDTGHVTITLILEDGSKEVWIRENEKFVKQENE